MVVKTLYMHKRAFQALKRTFMDVSGLPPPCFDKKNQLLYKNFFSYRNKVAEHLRLA